MNSVYTNIYIYIYIDNYSYMYTKTKQKCIRHLRFESQCTHNYNIKLL